MMICVLLGTVGQAEAVGKWMTSTFDGVDYVRLTDVWRFYGFSRKQGKPGYVSFGAGNRVVSLKERKQDFYMNNYRYILSYPVQERDGEMYISATDMSKLVDPVLRPRLTGRGKITTVVIDPGHGGHDAGAVSAYAREKDCNLAVGLKLRDKLRKAGFKVVMTRDRDFFLTLGERVAIANRTPDSLFVSIHHNSGRAGASGIETFTLAPHGTTSPFARTRRSEDLAGNNQDSENIALATAVHAHSIRTTSAIEGGFVTNPQEGSKVSSSSYQDTLAQCICDGIVRYIRNTRTGSAGHPRTGGGSTRTMYSSSGNARSNGVSAAGGSQSSIR